MGRNFPAIEFAGKKSPDLAFSFVDRYVKERLHRMRRNVKQPNWDVIHTLRKIATIKIVDELLAFLEKVT